MSKSQSEEVRRCGGLGLKCFRISFNDDAVDWQPAHSSEEALRLFLEDNPTADVHHVKLEELTGAALVEEMRRHGRIPPEQEQPR